MTGQLYPKVRLSKLREIGWTDWDPIGIVDLRESADDEYDRYLLHVVDMLCKGDTKQAAASYLNKIASEHMGLSVVDEQAATSTINAIANYLTTLPDGPKQVD